MNQILLTKVFPTALTASVLAMLFLAPEQARPGFWISIGVLWALNGIIFLGMRMKKITNLSITEDSVIVNGIRVNRSNIHAWRVFRSLHHGERGRYFEIQLKKPHPSRFEWKLAKFFEAIPTNRRCNHGIPIAEEPRIIVPLTVLDLSKAEIDKAMTSAKS